MIFWCFFSHPCLSQEWACWSKLFTHQPLDAIKDYYGVKIGLYFAWLGFYTAMLIPPSIAGVVCLVYGWATIGSNIPALDICGGVMANTIMCPQCDKSCETWLLQEACDVTWFKYLFDNNSIVYFGFFMSLWAAVFLESWKWYSAEIFHQWDVFGFDPEEEHPRPAYLMQLKDVKSKSWQVSIYECIEVGQLLAGSLQASLRARPYSGPTCTRIHWPKAAEILVMLNTLNRLTKTICDCFFCDRRTLSLGKRSHIPRFGE